MCGCSSKFVMSNHIPRRNINININKVSNQDIQKLKINFLKKFFKDNNIDEIHLENTLKILSQKYSI